MTQIVKLGGSVITRPGSPPEVDQETLARLAREVEGTEDLVIVHGAGSFGHPLAHEHDLAHGVDGDDQRDAMATVHAHLRRLNLAVLKALQDAGAPATTLSPFGMLGTNDAQPGSWNLVPVHRVLEQELVPVLHGDLVLDTMRGVTVLSGDTIVAELARFLEADRVVFALDQDGVYSHPPGHEEATLLDRPTPEQLAKARENATSGEGPDVTGGMAGKLREAVQAVRAGSEVCLVNGLEPDRVQHALEGNPKGTVLEPTREASA